MNPEAGALLERPPSNMSTVATIRLIPVKTGPHPRISSPPRTAAHRRARRATALTARKLAQRTRQSSRGTLWHSRARLRAGATRAVVHSDALRTSRPREVGWHLRGRRWVREKHDDVTIVDV